MAVPTYYSLQTAPAAPARSSGFQRALVGAAACLGVLSGYLLAINAQPSASALHLTRPLAAGYAAPALPSKVRRFANEKDSGIDVEVAEEGIGGEWPAHFVKPTKLGHPMQDLKMDMEEVEGIANEWPAHFVQPTKLGHPMQDLKMDMEEVEGIANEWPAHFVQPTKLGHPLEETEVNMEMVEGIANEWPAHFVQPKKLGQQKAPGSK